MYYRMKSNEELVRLFGANWHKLWIHYFSGMDLKGKIVTIPEWEYHPQGMWCRIGDWNYNQLWFDPVLDCLDFFENL